MDLGFIQSGSSCVLQNLYFFGLKFSLLTHFLLGGLFFEVYSQSFKRVKKKSFSHQYKDSNHCSPPGAKSQTGDLREQPGSSQSALLSLNPCAFPVTSF